MILESKTSEIITSQDFKEINFGIKQADMDLVIEILRSKMYKNPIAAICREISSNSRDANRESKTDSPVEIGFCDSPFIIGEQSIFFKDFGLGISPDRMADVFVNYGASTKRDSNEYTGGFGLGAKTPFSYTDNFQITTIFEEIKYIYCAAIEEGKKGKIYLLNSEVTCEPSGTTITVPIKEEDRYTFENEIYKSTFFWSQRPKYINFRCNYKSINLQKNYEDEKFIVYNNNDFIDGSYGLLLDGIYYPIDSSVMSFARNTVCSNLYIFKFSVGELTISANREALQYDEKTKRLIAERFHEFVELSKIKYDTEFEKNTTWISAYLFWSVRQTNSFYLFLDEQSDNYAKDFESIKTDLVKWKEKNSQFNNIKFVGNFENLFSMRFSFVTPTSKQKVYNINPKFETYPFYLLDTTIKNTEAKDITIFKEKSSNPGFFTILPYETKLTKWGKLPFSQKKILVKKMRNLLKELEVFKSLGLEFKLYSEVPKSKIEREKVIREKKVIRDEEEKVFEEPMNRNWQISRRKSYRPGNFTILNIKEGIVKKFLTEIDTKNDVLITVDSLYRIFDETEEIKLLRSAVMLNLIPTFNIYYMNKKRSKNFIGKFKTFEQKVSECLTTDIISKIIDMTDILSFENFLIFTHPKLNISFQSQKLSEISNKIKEFTNISEKLRKNRFTQSLPITNVIREKYKVLGTIQKFYDEIKEFYKYCSMLKITDSYQFNYEPEIIKEYVLLVEKDLMSKGIIA